MEIECGPVLETQPCRPGRHEVEVRIFRDVWLGVLPGAFFLPDPRHLVAAGCKVPLAHERGPVAGRGEHFGDIRLRSVGFEEVQHDPRMRRVASGHEHAAIRRAHRRRRKSIREQHAFTGESIEIRGGDVLAAAIGPDDVRTVLIVEDEENVGAPDVGGGLGLRSRTRRPCQEDSGEDQPFHNA